MNDFVVIGFKTEYAGDKATEWVEIAPSGEAFERTRTWHRIKSITPPENMDPSRKEGLSYKVLEARWNRIAPAYEAWKRGQDIPVDGTPLAAWAGVSPEQAAHMRAMGILTVEGVRDMGEGAIARLPFPNARQMPKLAADFLSSKTEADKDRELADMRERMAIMEEMLAARTGKLGQGTPEQLQQHPSAEFGRQPSAEDEPAKRGPGRPKKQTEEAACPQSLTF